MASAYHDTVCVLEVFFLDKTIRVASDFSEMEKFLSYFLWHSYRCMVVAPSIPAIARTLQSAAKVLGDSRNFGCFVEA